MEVETAALIQPQYRHATPWTCKKRLPPSRSAEMTNRRFPRPSNIRREVAPVTPQRRSYLQTPSKDVSNFDKFRKYHIKKFLLIRSIVIPGSNLADLISRRLAGNCSLVAPRIRCETGHTAAIVACFTTARYRAPSHVATKRGASIANRRQSSGTVTRLSSSEAVASKGDDES